MISLFSRPEKKLLLWISLGLGLIILSGVIFSFFIEQRDFLLWITEHSKALRVWTAQSKPAATMLYFAVLAVAATIGFPPTGAIIFIGGALLGSALAFFIALPAVGFGALGPFLLTRRFGAPWLQQKFGDAIETLRRGVEGDGARYLFSLRLLPMVPFTSVNVGMALTNISATTFFLVTIAGRLPVTYIYSEAGKSLANLGGIDDVITWKMVGGLCTLAVLPHLSKAIARQLNRQQVT